MEATHVYFRAVWAEGAFRGGGDRGYQRHRPTTSLESQIIPSSGSDGSLTQDFTNTVASQSAIISYKASC